MCTVFFFRPDGPDVNILCGGFLRHSTISELIPSQVLFIKDDFFSFYDISNATTVFKLQKIQLE